MAVYNYISSKEILAKIYDDLDFSNENVRIAQIITWIGEALGKIGAYPYYKNRVTGIEDTAGTPDILVISNYRALLPCDLHSIIQLAVSTSSTGNYIPARIATGSFEISKGTVQTGVSSGVEDQTFPVDDYTKIEFISDIFNESYQDAVTRLNSDPNINTILDQVFLNDNSVIGDSTLTEEDDITYTINPPYIDINLKTGYAMLAYKAVPLDSEGFPLVPDDEDVKEALKWYVEMMLTYIMWRHNVTGGERLYNNAKLEWIKKKKASYGNLMMPSADEMKSIQNIWNRFIPNINEDQSFYKDIGKQEIIYRK